MKLRNLWALSLVSTSILLSTVGCEEPTDGDSNTPTATLAPQTQAPPTETAPGATDTRFQTTQTEPPGTPGETPTAEQGSEPPGTNTQTQPLVTDPPTPTATSGPASVVDSATVPVAGVTNLSVSHQNGSVQLLGNARRPTATVSWNVQLEADANPLLISQIAVSAEVAGGVVLVVETSVPEGIEDKLLSFDLVVEVPPALVYDVNCRGGDVGVDGMESGGAINSGNGGVVGTGLSGSPLSVQSLAGDIDVQTVVGLNGDIDISAVSGEVTLRIPNNTSAAVTASASDGTVRFLNLEFDGTNALGNASGTVGDGSGSSTIAASTGSGDITFIGTATLPQPTPTPGEDTPPPGTPPLVTATPGGTPATPGEVTPTPTLPTSGDNIFTGNAQIPVNSATELSVDNPYGSTVINGLANTPLVTASYRLVLLGPAAGAITSQLEVKLSRDGATIVVNPVVPAQLVDQIAAYRLTINTPARLNWGAELGGDLDIDAMSGGGVANLSAGNVVGTGISGDVAITAATSNIDLGATLEGSQTVAVVVDSGPITLRVPAAAGASLSANTGDGAVTVEGISLDGTNDGGAVEGDLGAGGDAAVNLSTGAGDIAIIGE